MGIESRQIEKSQFRKLPEKREIRFEMAHKFREVHLLPVEIGERHHGRRSVIIDKHRKLIDEVADGGLRSSLSVVDLRGKEAIGDLQLIREKADFFGLGFKVLMPLIQEPEIEHSDAPLNEFNFLLATIANVLAIDLAVKTPREQVIDGSTLWKTFGPGVFRGVKLVPEGVGAVAPMGGEGEELTLRSNPNRSLRCTGRPKDIRVANGGNLILNDAQNL
jgi:hypothetical protein